MSPEELKHKSARVLNNIEPSIEADLTELDILQASENLEAYQEETSKWRNKKVVNREIAEGDWVLRRKPNAETIGKLQSKWDGPYIVILQQARILSLGGHRRERAAAFLEC